MDPSARGTSSPLRVLVIDDESDVRGSLRRFLEDRDYDVFEAENGRVGIAALRRERPDLILVDLRMPEVDGLEVLAVAQRETPDTPIIVVSGTGIISDAIEALRLGAWDYVLKPIAELSILQNALERSLERARLIAENRRYQASLENLVQARTAELDHRLATERMVADISADLARAAPDEIAPSIQRAVQRMGELTQVDRCYVVVFSPDKQELGAVYAWNAPGVEARFHRHHGLQSDMMPWAMGELEQFKAVHAPDLDALPPEARAEKAVWEGAGVKSLLAVPLVDAGALGGFMGFSLNRARRAWDQEDINMLRLVGQVVGSVLARSRAQAALRESEHKLATLISNLPGFVYRCANDRDWTMEFISQGCRDITGYAPEDFLHNKKLAFNDIVHPDYREPLWNQWQESLRQRQAFEAEYPLLAAGGEIRWVWERGRGIWSEAGGEGSRLLFLEGFITDITPRKQAEELLRESERRFREIFETVQLIAVMLDAQGRITFCNGFLLELTGWQLAEVVGQNWFDLFVPPEQGVWQVFQSAIAQGVFPAHYENDLVTRQGERRLVWWNNTMLRDVYGNVIGTASIGEDITGRRQVEAQIRAALKEKETLLREIHHRVKNNMQIMVSLLNLQAGRLQDPQLLPLFRDYQNRIRSMAFVHERLYESPTLSSVDFAVYVNRLAAHLLRALAFESGAVELKLDVEQIWLGMDQAVPCGLIINELISNSLKYAFPDPDGEGAREVCVQMRLQAGQVSLVVSDNGIGLPEDLDWRNAESLGMQLINILTGQLQGSIELDRNGGTTFRVTFAARQTG